MCHNDMTKCQAGCLRIRVLKNMFIGRFEDDFVWLLSDNSLQRLFQDRFFLDRQGAIDPKSR